MKIFSERIKIPKTLVESFNLIETKQLEEVTFFFGTVKFLNDNIHKFKQLKYVQLTSAGYDKLSEDILKSNLVITNAKGVYSEAISEYVMSFVLAELKNHESLKQSQKKQEWNKAIHLSSAINKTILCLGTGSIAYEVAKRAKAFGMKVIGVNSDGRKIEGFDDCTVMSDHKTLKQADFVISTLPLNQETKKSLGYDFFRTLKDDAVFINIGRGEVVDEKALLEVLSTKLSKVILDVFVSEPLNRDSLFWTHPKVIVTPHISYKSEHNDENHLYLLERQLQCISDNKPLLNQI